MKISWTHYGPTRQDSNVDVPPNPSLIDGYVLSYDEALEKIVYACVPKGSIGASLHAFDGKLWSKISQKPFKRPGGRVEGGGYDSIRRGTVLWGFAGSLPVGAVVKASGAAPLKMQGDLPKLQADGSDDLLMFDKKAIFAFDRARDVWVCLTRCGVWELAGDGTWSRRADVAGGVPQKWLGAEGAFDPVRKRVVFLIVTRERYERKTKTGFESGATHPSVLLSWDGKELLKLNSDGLPELCFNSNPCAQLASHPGHGLVIHAGAGRMFVPDGSSSWKSLPAPNQPPPSMEDSCLAHDPKRDLLSLGPGKHEGAGGSDRQNVFFVLRDGTWERQGIIVTSSAIAPDAQPSCCLAHLAGDWYATGTDSLRAWKWTEQGWQTLVSFVEPNRPEVEVVGANKEPVLVSRGAELALLATDKLWAVTCHGAVYALEGERWHVVAKDSPLFKDRREFVLAADNSGRLVVWGGESNGRKLNDTLFFEGGKWTVAKKASPPPRDFKHGNRDDVWVGFAAAYDSTLGSLVRFGYEEAAILEGEVWKPCVPKNYKKLISERRAGHFPVHDATTGETLLIDLHGAKIVRFDLAECAVVATMELPRELQKGDPFYGGTAASTLEDSFSYDPVARALFAQHLRNSAGVYRLDLGAAFDRAKALGPRKIPKEAPDAKAATRSPSKPVDREALLAQVGVASQALAVGKPSRAAPASRLGGLPSKVTPTNWPCSRKKPMGFLFQIETGALLREHAGLAVFCAIDGEATDGLEENAVVLLSAADLAEAGSAPGGLPLLACRSLVLGASKMEIDERRALALAQKDAELGAAIEALAGAKGMQAPGLASKLGGVPLFLQNAAMVKGHRFVAQLDFDDIEVSETWPDAGLMGCVYVFVREDETGGQAFWQAT